MASIIAGLAAFTVLCFSGCAKAGQSDRAVHLTVSPSLAVRVSEPGVVPEGTLLLVRTNDTVNASRALRGTIYDASVPKDFLDQDGNMLIPKGSPVELEVRALSYLGPGGAGVSELTLSAQAVTVNGVRYPLETTGGKPLAGGLAVDRNAPRVINAGESRGQVLVRGHHINVPAGTELAFRLGDPIRLKGYLR